MALLCALSVAFPPLPASCEVCVNFRFPTQDLFELYCVTYNFLLESLCRVICKEKFCDGTKCAEKLTDNTLGSDFVQKTTTWNSLKLWKVVHNIHL